MPHIPDPLTRLQPLDVYVKKAPRVKLKPSTNGQHHNSSAGKTGAPKTVKDVFTRLGYYFDVECGDEDIAQECPFCQAENKFYLNRVSGQYSCKAGSCGQSGNHVTFLTWYHKEMLDGTTKGNYSELGDQRGICPQTLERHELAWDTKNGKWLLPFKTPKGTVANFVLYNPETRMKQNMDYLDACIYGLDRLAKDTKNEKRIFICEGVFDAIALDYAFPSKHRPRYVILAVPGASTFKKEWLTFFKDRWVTLLYDNDEAGRTGVEKASNMLLDGENAAKKVDVLLWPNETTDKYDINDWVRDLGNDRHSILEKINDRVCTYRKQPKLKYSLASEQTPEELKPEEWIWYGKLRTGALNSVSGYKKSLKSTLVRNLVALYTQGKPMPFCETATMPAGSVIYVTAEDSTKKAKFQLKLLGADLSKIIVIGSETADGGFLSVLDSDVLAELKQLVNEHKCRWVVIDGQNSVLGCADISSDMKARHNVTNKLHQFAQKENICLMGIRNANKEGRALGAHSYGDIARAGFEIEQLEGNFNPRRFSLKAVGNDSEDQKPIPFEAGKYPFINWEPGQEVAKITDEQAKDALAAFEQMCQE